MTDIIYIPTEPHNSPEEEGYYHTVGVHGDMVAYYYPPQGRKPIYEKTNGWDALITHWLKPVRKNDYLREQIEQVVADMISLREKVMSEGGNESNILMVKAQIFGLNQLIEKLAITQPQT